MSPPTPERRTRTRTRTDILKLLGMAASGVVFIVGTAFGAMTYLDNHNDDKYVKDMKYQMFASGVHHSFIDTQRKVVDMELRWLDKVPAQAMSQGDKRRYEYLQESQKQLDIDKKILIKDALKEKKIKEKLANSPIKSMFAF
jgi:hypothetical protein